MVGRVVLLQIWPVLYLLLNTHRQKNSCCTAVKPKMSLEYMGESSRKHETPRFFHKKIKTWKLNKWPLHFTHLFGYGFCIESKKAIVLIHLFSQRCIPVVPYNLSNESLLLSLQDLNLSNIFYSYSVLKKSWFHSQIFFSFSCEP